MNTNNKMNTNSNKNKSLKLFIGISIGFILMVISVFAYINYLGPGAWKLGVNENNQGTDDFGNPWIGSKEPKIIIHEYLDYECPHCPTIHMRLRQALILKWDDVRLVRHNYARMTCIPNSAKSKFYRCEMVRAAFCAGKLGNFWKWNDAVIEHPKPFHGVERKEYLGKMIEEFKFDLKEFNECLFSQETINYAQSVYVDTKKHKINETPTYLIDNKKYSFIELIEELDKR